MSTETKNQRTNDSIEALTLLTIGMSSLSHAMLAQKVLDAVKDLQELQERRKADEQKKPKPIVSDGNALAYRRLTGRLALNMRRNTTPRPVPLEYTIPAHDDEWLNGYYTGWNACCTTMLNGSDE